MIGAKNEDVAAMRLEEIVADLIDENLVAGVDRAARDYFTAADGPADKHVEIVAQRLGRRIDEILAMIADDPR